MATKGTYTAYQRLQPIQEDFSDELYKADAVGFRNRQEQERLKQQKKKEDEEWANKLGTSLSAMKDVATGVNSVDEMNARVILKGRDMMRDAYEKIKKNPTDIDAILAIKNLEKLPENLMTYEKRYADYATDIGKGIQEGKYDAHLNKELLKKLDNAVGKYNAFFDLDKTGSLVGVQVDPDEDDSFEFKTLQEVLSGEGLEQPILKADYNASQAEIKKMFTTHKNTDQQGYQIDSSTGLRPEDIEGIGDATDRLWGETVDDMSNFAKSVIASGLGAEPSSVDDQTFQEFKDQYKDEIISSYATEKSKTIDNSARIAAAREARLRKKDEKNEPTVGEGVTPTPQKWGKHYKNIDPTKVNAVPTGNVEIDAIPLKSGTTLSNVNVQNYTYDKDGNMVIDASYQETKSKTMSQEEFENLQEKAKKGDVKAQEQTENYSYGNNGEIKVTLPGSFKKEQIKVTKETESKIAMALELSIEELRAQAYKEQTEQEPTTEIKLSNKASAL